MNTEKLQAALAEYDSYNDDPVEPYIHVIVWYARQWLEIDCVKEQ